MPNTKEILRTRKEHIAIKTKEVKYNIWKTFLKIQCSFKKSFSQASADLEVQLVQLNHCDGV